jgi:hypothetical protein
VVLVQAAVAGVVAGYNDEGGEEFDPQLQEALAASYEVSGTLTQEGSHIRQEHNQVGSLLLV